MTYSSPFSPSAIPFRQPSEASEGLTEDERDYRCGEEKLPP